MARPAATDEQRSEQRRRIRHAAVEIYNEDGASAVSARAIAKRAGVSTGLLYSYFSNMSELMRSIWIRPVAEFGDEVDDIVAAHLNPLDRIQALLVGYVAWAQRHPEAYRGVLLYVRPAGSPVERGPVDALTLPRALRIAIADGQAAGLVADGDPSELAQVLWAGVHGALALPINLDRFDITPAVDLAPAIISVLMRSITSPAPTNGTK